MGADVHPLDDLPLEFVLLLLLLRGLPHPVRLPHHKAGVLDAEQEQIHDDAGQQHVDAVGQQDCRVVRHLHDRDVQHGQGQRQQKSGRQHLRKAPQGNEPAVAALQGHKHQQIGRGVEQEYAEGHGEGPDRQRPAREPG